MRDKLLSIALKALLADFRSDVIAFEAIQRKIITAAIAVVAPPSSNAGELCAPGGWGCAVPTRM